MAKEYPVNPIPGRVFSEADIVYIVAGGPSLRTFTWERLAGKKVITINKALYKVPDAKLIFWVDDRFYEENKDAIHAHKAPCKVSGYSDLVRFHYPESVYAYRFGRIRGFDESVAGLATGNNSGYSAINLAVKIGARRLVLLGYDFQYDEAGNSHWHEGYYLADGSRRSHKEATLVLKMLPHFEALKEPLQKMKVSVYNANMGSALTVWPRISVEEALALA